MFGWFSSKVAVTFIDDATGEVFAVSKLQPNDLPESFELETTLHIRDQDWFVVEASPKSRAACAASKALTLRLRRVEKVDPQSILFSLPSICDSIPATGQIGVTGQELLLAEDDWRQFELVSAQLDATVNEDLRKIRRIHEEERMGPGWKKIHVRESIEEPIAEEIDIETLKGILQISTASMGIAYRGAKHSIKDGYAFPLNEGLTVYGRLSGNTVRVIAFTQDSTETPPSGIIQRVATLARTNNLNLVNWCRCAKASSNEPMFERLFANAPN